MFSSILWHIKVGRVEILHERTKTLPEAFRVKRRVEISLPHGGVCRDHGTF